MDNVPTNKEDITLHGDSHFSPQYPAINVKVGNFGVTSFDVMDKFDCDEDQADRALQFAFESAQHQFWEEIQEHAESVLGKGVKVYSAGRSGGYVIVERLEEIKHWDAVAFAKWRKFVKEVLQQVEYLCSEAVILDAIVANEWHKLGSELYNFYEFVDGHSECMADMKAKAIEAGLGPVVRA
jgi:hypothetical protein